MMPKDKYDKGGYSTSNPHREADLSDHVDEDDGVSRDGPTSPEPPYPPFN